MINENSKIIAVDFDGTIVEDRYPGIGKPIPFAIESLLRLQQLGHRIILWTYRHGKRLDEAVTFCRERGLEFYAVNKSFPEEKDDAKVSRKIMADVFIDDRNLGGIQGWGEIFHLIHGENLPEKKKKPFWFKRRTT